MAKINVLPAALASQIAAGEVVERPASAAKELIENALDAEASRCDVGCTGGGVTSLTVSDDGTGMTEQDATRSIERHATSKLTSVADLNRLSTFGFRGEALPSIASVSRFSLRTRTRDSDFGCSVEIEGGKSPVIRREGMPVGTTVAVRDLFYNVPARRKFLRSTGTESAHITTAVEGAALARPDVTFTLERDGRRVRELLRVLSRRERVLQVLTEETLAEVVGERGPLRLEAHLSTPERARPGASGLWLLVNGRVVRDRMLAATIAQAYGAVLATGNYPRGVVYLDLAPELVDVNVHPQKAEVRFVDPRATADAVYAIVSRAVTAAFALPPGNRGSRQPAARGGSTPPPALLPIERGHLPQRPREVDRRRQPDPWGTQQPAGGALAGATPERRGAPNVAAATVTPLVKREASDPRDVEFAPDDGSEPEARTIESVEVEHTPLNARAAEAPSMEAAAPRARAAGMARPDRAALGAQDGQPESPNPAAILPIPDESEEPAPPTLLNPPSDIPLGAVLGQLASETPSVAAHKGDLGQEFGKLKFLAQVRLTFLVCEGTDGLYVIDQHAAAERVAYARLLAQYHAHSMASQALLFPAMIDLLPREVELLDAQQDTCRALGLDVQVRGENRISIHSVPRLLQRASPERLIRDLLGELGQKGSRGFSTAIEQAIALMACHGSLRAGEVLTPQQAQALLSSLDSVDPALQCTHGRPVVAVTRFVDLERQVGRR